MRRYLTADVLMLACVVVWGLNFTIAKFALVHFFLPLAYSAARFGIATITFAGLAYGRERTLRVDPPALRTMVAIGASVILVNQVAFVYAIQLASASTVSLLFGTMPIFAALFSRERQSGRHWLAAGISFGGVALVAVGSGSDLSGDLGGILLGITAAAAWALYSVLLQPYVATYSSARVNTVTAVACCIPFLAIATPQFARQDWEGVNLTGWSALVFSGVIAYALTNVVWLVVIDRVGTPRASIYVNLQPFLGSLFAVVLLSERLHAIQIAGGAVIAAGIVVARWRTSLAVPPHE
jgi:drug/metabolite transporter (DMT)-like permease